MSNILSWSEWRRLSESEDLPLSYTNPKFSREELWDESDKETLDLFGDKSAEREARSDIHKELGWRSKRTRPEMDPLDRENPEAWVKTRINATINQIGKAIEQLGQARSRKERESISAEIDRLADRLVYYKSVQKDIKAQEGPRRRI